MEPFYNENEECKKGKVYKGKLIITDDDLLSYSSQTPVFRYNCCKFEKGISIKVSYPVEFFFFGCIFFENVAIETNSKGTTLNFSDCNFKADAQLNLKQANIVDFLNSRSHGLRVSFALHEVQHFSYITDSIHEHGKPIKTQNDCYFNFVKVGTAEISGTFNSLIIEGNVLGGSNLNVRNIRVNALKFEKFSNFGQLRLDSISPIKNNPSFCIINSSLGDAYLSSVDLGSFRDIFISKSALSKIEIASSSFPTESSRYLERYNNVAVCDKVDLFRQLKHVFDKQKDHLVAQQFHALELEEYRKKIKRDGAAKWFNDEWRTGAVIFLSKLTSNFGQDWGRPLLFLFGGHLMLFWLAIGAGAFPGLSFDCCNPTWDGFDKGVEYFCKTLIPTHKLEGGLFDGWTMVINLIMRAWSAYMIYNFVRATRRFIR